MRRRLVVLCLMILALLLILPSAEGFAQKKTVKTPPAATQAKSGGLFKDWLTQHVGLPSNHGTLQKVAADFVIFEDEEGSETAVPMTMIQSVTVKKEQEDEESPVKTVLVIKLLSAE